MSRSVRLVFAALLICLTNMMLPAHALEGDRDQPATLDADQFDLDFQTGVRTYRGNVIYTQGSIKLTADEVVAYFKDGELEKAIARGNPARFKQRPEGESEDFIGTGMRIELNEITRLVTMETRATVTQGNNTVTGKKITYNLDTEKANVKSGPRQTAASTTGSSIEDGGDGGSDVEQAARPRLIIKPRTRSK